MITKVFYKYFIILSQGIPICVRTERSMILTAVYIVRKYDKMSNTW